MVRSDVYGGDQEPIGSPETNRITCNCQLELISRSNNSKTYCNNTFKILTRKDSNNFPYSTVIFKNIYILMYVQYITLVILVCIIDNKAAL